MLARIDYYIDSLTHSFRKPSLALPLCLALALARGAHSSVGFPHPSPDHSGLSPSTFPRALGCGRGKSQGHPHHCCASCPAQGP